MSPRPPHAVVAGHRTRLGAWAVLAVAALAGAGCVSTRLTAGGQGVRVLAAGPAPADCVRQGDIEVAVDTGVGPVQRDRLSVRDQLETLARNRAPGLGATHVQPLGPPVEGVQRFHAWRCPAGR